MAQRKIIHDDADPAQKNHPDLSNNVATEAEFMSAVEVVRHLPEADRPQ
jgi:hypothetical protein